MPKTTWLSVYWDAWARHCKGELNAGQASKVFKAIEEEVGREEAIAQWLDYLACTPPIYCSVQRFSERHGLYGSGKDDPPAVLKTRPATAGLVI